MKKKEAMLTGAIVIIAIYTLTVSVVTQVFPAVQSTKTLSSSGSIQTIGVAVFSDAQCSSPVTSIPWGVIEPGTSQQYLCYIKNVGNAPSVLSMPASPRY